MAKLGSKKRPVVARVRTQERGAEIAALCAEHDWYYIIGIEPHEPEDVSDVERLLNPLVPEVAEKTARRNDPCPCGSGKKYKKCCMGK